jgi:CheY-like chemotaxis protein
MEKILLIERDDDVYDIIELIAKDLKAEFLGSPHLLPVHEIAQLHPSIVVIDHRAPFGFGGDLCKEIKTDPRTQNIKVILISSDWEISKVADDNLADGYLQKPFDADAITETVSKVLCSFDMSSGV